LKTETHFLKIIFKATQTLFFRKKSLQIFNLFFKNRIVVFKSVLVFLPNFLKPIIAD